jgi:rfaE bifunctional protein nucleotidyltransferase chain/domain
MKHPKPHSKIHTLESLGPVLGTWRQGKRKIVFTNGCFDIVHRGHVHYLSLAAELGDVFVIGVNSDASVRRLGKGPERPIQDEVTRATILASFGFVDAVIIFDEDTPLELISKIEPQVLVKGADWKGKGVVGSEIVEKNGGSVVFVDTVDGFSTTNIVKKLRE